MPITLVTGQRNSGKTRYLKNLSTSINTWGILSEKIVTGRAFIGYDALYIIDGTHRPLAREHARGLLNSEWFKYRRFFFNTHTFVELNSLLIDSLQLVRQKETHAEHCILDEAGPLEMDGLGFAPAIEELVSWYKTNKAVMYISVRPSLVSKLQARFGFVAKDVLALS